MRGRRATKKKEVVDDRPFNYPPGNKQQQQGKQAKLKKLWLGDVVESDEGYPQVVVLQENPPEALREQVAAARLLGKKGITLLNR